MYKLVSVLENEKHIIFWDFLGTNHLIPVRRPDLVIVNTNKKGKRKRKKACRIVDFAILADHRLEIKENEKSDKYLDFARELKKQWNMKVTVTPAVISALGTITNDFGKRSGRVGNRRTSGDYPNYSIIKIDQNTGDLRRHRVVQIPVKDHQPTLVLKTR